MTRPRRLHARRPGSDRRRRTLLGALVGSAVGLVVFVTVPGLQPGAGADTPATAPGSQGVVTALSPTSSAVSVSGSGAYAGLKVTVNQTSNLVDQAVSVSWTGGTQTTSSSAFQSDYLQIFQCWSARQTNLPAGATDPGPSPTQCQFGGETVSSTAYPVKEPGFEYSRVLSQKGWSTFPAACNQTPTPTACTDLGYFDPTTGFLVQPFDAVDGTVVGQQADYNYDLDPNNPKPFWKNPYFRYGTSNEVDFARTYADGTGQQLFQVQTGLEAPGLGCGQQLEPAAGGGLAVPECWLVVVPRGSAATEDPAGVVDPNVVTSPLTPAAWANRITIPLSFNPVGSSCGGDASASQIVGNEVASQAVASWQPGLCAQPGSPSYGYIQNTDDEARQNLVDPTYGSVGMSVYSMPVDPSLTSSTNPIVYAPLTLSGVAVAFNIQRVPAPGSGQNPPPEQPLSGTQVANLYLTPRLMAKLLTQSYQAQLQNVTATKPAADAWALHNPVDLFTDPDFLHWNPEFALLSTTQAIDAGNVVVEEGNSDATAEVWKWILADPEARAWLDQPEQPGQSSQGMEVNPYYSLNPAVNPSGVPFGSPLPSNFPKSDPYCYSTGEKVIGPPSAPARPLCLLDWAPYALNLQGAAQAAGAANDGAKTTFNPALTPNTAWTANGPQVPGTHFVLSITDTPSAARYGLQTAALSRAGDDGDGRTFIAPDAAGLLAGEHSFVPSAVPGVVVPDPATTVAGAYPLTVLSYAATTPETLTPSQRKQYAAFLLYAVGDGQTPGVEPGQLPAGYVPLPGALRLESLMATNTIINPPAEPTAAAGASTPSPTGTSATDVGSVASTGDTTGTGALPDTGTSTSTVTATQGHAAPQAVVGLVHTSALSAGTVRFFLPLLLLIGVGAALGSLALSRAGRPAGDPEGGTEIPAGEWP